MNLSDFQLHSGGAKGADTWWASYGYEFGIPHSNITHWRPEDYDRLDDESKEKVDEFVKIVARSLGRPESFSGVKLVKRNVFQVEHADAIFAIGRIIKPGEKDSRGFVNQTDHQIVEGGTGWAVEMAIQLGKPVYVYDMDKNWWFMWAAPCGHCDFEFLPVPVSVDGLETYPPKLTKDFAGIGSRKITPEAIQAIKDVYQKTIEE